MCSRSESIQPTQKFQLSIRIEKCEENKYEALAVYFPISFLYILYIGSLAVCSR